ncbi:hypothetical protein PF005_g5786 [Phytophthora fragariae]|uniref:IPT/TIG domain-containing protein n=1 Tax=Phytophthora fragariae TaxID=53985 RepID=A0A6A4E7D0_9STRA|nr:hypothetical protein PF005_g5786 [Phytophthora fragariae]KAE9321097.1 hypothetical protein PF001_g5084 [Phytophthora fragariae]
MPQWLLLPLFYLFSIASTTTSNIDPSRSAVVALLPRHLVAFYPLLSDSLDYAPDGCANGYSQDALSTRRSTTGSTSTSNVAITQNLGLRLEQGTGLDLPLSINSCNFRQLTIGGWVQTGEAMAVTQGCLLSQNGSSVGRSVCVDRGTWVVGGREVRGVEVNLDQWSFVAAVFDDSLTKFYVDGEMVEVDIVVKSVASQLLVVGAGENQPLSGFSGHLKSVFVFDVALSETELDYLITTRDVAPKEPGDLVPVSAPAVDLVPKSEPIPHFYLKDRLDNLVNARQVIDPDGDEYNAALPTIDDTELLSVKLVYANDIVADSSKTVANVSTTPFKLWSVEPLLREVHIGSKVTVQGSSKFDSHLSMCRINGDVVFAPEKVTANSITCLIPDVRIQRTTMEFFISQNGIDFVSVGLFILRNRPQVFRLSPAQVLRSIKPQVIDIFGMDFVNLTTLSCSLGGIPSHAVFLSSSRIQCVVEPMRYGQTLESVAVHVSINGVDYSEDSSDLGFINLPAFSGLSPDNGPVNGGTTVTLSGQGFREDTRYAILYQPNMLKDVTFVSEKLLSWTTSPVNATGRPYVVKNVDSRITVRGQGFLKSSHVICAFGQETTSGAVITSEVVACAVPTTLLANQDYELRVSLNNGTHFSRESALVYVYDLPTFRNITAVSKDKKTVLQVTGSGFVINGSAALMIDCVFGSYGSVAARVENVSSLTPASVVGTGDVVVECTLNGDAITRGELSYHYLLTPHASRVTPQIGLATANTTVLVDGSDFSTTYPMMCRFGNVSSSATVTSSSQLQCVAPPQSPGIVNVSVGLEDIPVKTSCIGFEYIEEPRLHQVIPPLGPEMGSTRLLLVGDDFNSRVEMRCTFSRGDGSSPVTTTAFWASKQGLVCFTPPFSPGVAYVQVAVGNTLSSSKLKFNFTVEPRVLYISPQRSSGAGNVIVAITGVGFVDSDLLRCNLGAATSGIVPVRVTNNNQDYTSDPVAFVFYPPVVVDYATPLFGLVDEPTTRIEVAGHSFHENMDLTCGFSGIEPNRGSELGQYEAIISGSNFIRGAGLRCQFGVSDVVAAKWLSDTSISCPVPPHSPGWVDVQVTNNLQDYSVERVRFEYVVSPVVLGFEPTKVYAQDDERIILHGRDFRNSSDVYCMIGNELTETTFLSSSKLRCGSATLVESSVVIGVIDLSLSMVGVFADERLSVLDDGVWSLCPRVTSARGETPVVLSRLSDASLEFEAIYGRFCTRNRSICSDLTRTEYLQKNKFRWLPPRWTGAEMSGVVEIFRMKDVSRPPASPIATFPYRYYREVVLTSLTPSIGAVTGGTVVTLSGLYFQDGHNLSCVVNGATFVPAQFITDTMISCTMPPLVSGPRAIGVFVSFNGLEISEASLAFTYVEEPSVVSIFPTGGPVTGTTVVSVAGAHFVSTSKSVCRFGDRTVPAMVVSSTEVSCLVQPATWASIGRVRFQFSSNGQEFSQESISYLFFKNPSLIEIHPRVGSVNGGTKLALTWENTIPNDYIGNVSCKIGPTAGEVLVATGTTLSVVVPAYEFEGPVTTQISINGQNYVEGPPFWYLFEPRIDSIYPNSSSEAASTWVQVSGVGFPRLPSLLCRFGDSDKVAESPAEWVSEKLLICRAPLHRPGIVDFTFTMNVVDTIDPKLKFTFTPKTSIRDFFPLSGPTIGGTVLTIPADTEVQQCRRVYCIMGHFKAIGSIDPKSPELKCLVPPQDQPGQVSVSVECDARVLVEFQTPFHYYDAPVIADIEPRSMSIGLGGAISVRGQNFCEGTTYCRFDSDIVTVAVPVSSSVIRCPTPSFAFHPAFSYVNLEVSSNGVDYTTSGSKLQLTPPLEVVDITPRDGIIDQELEVYITLSARVVEPDDLVTCRAGEVSVVPAFMVSRSSIVCKLPAVSSPGKLVVAVSSNGVDYVGGGTSTTISYHPAPQEAPVSHSGDSGGHIETQRDLEAVKEIRVLSVEPKFGPVRGGSIVIMEIDRVTDYDDDLMCVFGGETIEAAKTKDGVVACKTPPANIPGSVLVGVSYRDQERISSGDLGFTYNLDEMITSVSPKTLVASKQGTNFKLHGLNFYHPDEASTALCRVGTVLTRATIISSTEVVCSVVTLGPGEYPVAVACDGVNFVSSAELVTVIRPMWITAIQPSVVAVSGGMEIEVKGAAFSVDSPVNCSFGRGRFLVAANVVSSTMLRCTTPAVGEHSLTLPVSISLEESSSNELLLSFEAPIVFIAALPSFGFSNGGTTVRIDVSRAPTAANMLCLFGDTHVRAKRLSSTQISCKVPPHQPGEVRLAVQGDAALDVAGLTLPFTFLPDISIEKVSPSRGTAAGGSEVALTLSQPVDLLLRSLIMCRFGAISTPVVSVVEAQVTCISPPGRQNEQVVVAIAVNGEDVSVNTLGFKYFASQELVSIEPRTASVDAGNVTLRVLLENAEFGDGLAYQCGFESATGVMVFSSADVLITGELECSVVSPFPGLPGQVFVSVWQNGERYSSNTRSFGFVLASTIEKAPPSISLESEGTGIRPYTARFDEIYPASGAASGGTRVLVLGLVDENLAYSCLFDGEPVPAVPLNSSTLSCIAPASTAPRRVQVQILLFGTTVETDFPLWFTYYDDPSIESVFPLTAKTVGGEEILLSGKNFLPTSTLRCQFGDSGGIPAVFVSPTTILCVAPPRTAAGYVAVEVSLNGVDYTSSRQSLYYFDYVDVLAVAPQRVSTAGGTELHLTLAAESSHVNASIDCVFVRPASTVRRPAYLVTSTDVMCYSPVWTPGQAAVGILVNSKQQFMADTPLDFVAEPSIDFIEPDHGPTTGGTLVTVFGEALADTSIVSLFDGIQVIPRTITDRQVTCIVPAQTSNSSTVDVRVEIGPSISSNAVEFTYEAPIQVSNVSIRKLPEDGGSVVTVTGANFLNTTELCCSLGAQLPPVQAEFVNSTLVKCPIGPVRLAQMNVGVSNNGYDFVFFGEPVVYVASPHITAIYPTTGPVEGGTPVQLTLANTDSLKDENMKMFCSFGDQDTTALMTDDNVVTCTSPGVAQPSTVIVSLYWRSSDLEDRFDAEKQIATAFYYSVFPELTDVSPPSGSVAEGTVVTLSGSGFRDGLSVRFGIGPKAREVAAMFVSESIVMADVPEELEDGVTSIAVTANEVDYSNSLTFYIRPRPVLHSVYPPEVSVVSSEQKITLSIYGTSFTETARETMKCRIGDDGSVIRVQWISATQIACPAPYLDAGLYSVYVALNGENFVNDGLKVFYRETFLVCNIAPTFGVLGGNTRVQVYGSNIHGGTNESDLVCVFGTRPSPLQVVNASLAECVAPSQPKVGSVPFSVARLADVNPQYKARGGLTYFYHRSPVLSKILPAMIRASHASPLRIIGANFLDSVLLSCLIGGVSVPGRYVSSNAVECLLAEMTSGAWLPDRMLGVEVSNNGQDFSNSELQILVQAPIKLLRMEPTQGIIRQSHAVKIFGEHLSSLYQNLKCHVGETQLVLATNLGDGWLECVLPASPFTTTTQISVSIDGVDYTADSLSFTYEDTPVVYSISPQNGSFEGGTLVNVHGEGFGLPGPLYCAFGSSIVRAEVQSSLVAKCTSPPYSPHLDQVVSVAVGRLEALAALESLVYFSYVEMIPEISSASPQVEEYVETWPEEAASPCSVYGSNAAVPLVKSVNPTSGSVLGGTNVTLNGQNFVAGPRIVCVFGGEESVATFVNDSLVWCLVPPQEQPTTLYVRLKVFDPETPGRDCVSESLTVYEYQRQLEFTSMFPTKGPCTGGTELKLTMANVVDSPGLSCAFTIALPSQPQLLRVNVQAQYHNDDFLSCITPSLALALPSSGDKWYENATGVAQVEVSNNGVDFAATGKNFTFTPLVVPALQVTTVDLESPSDDAETEEDDDLDAANESVDVSWDDQDDSNTTSVVVYPSTPGPIVYSLEPNHGPLEGGTEVVVTGINFQNSSRLRCKFGERVTAAAMFLSSTQFTCVSPSGLTEGDVFVEVANWGLIGTMDELMFSNSKILFTYDGDLQIDSVFPSLGPTTGNFSVRLTGGKFRKTDAVRCKFAEIVVVATWVSFDEILCMAPPHSPGVFTLEVTRNAQDYTDTRVPFLYYAEQGVRSISPTFGPAYAAGTRIDVDGVAFVNSSLLSCRFGYVVTPGEYLNPTQMRCTTPPLPQHSGGLIAAPLPEYWNQWADPNVGSVYLFPDAHYYPQYFTHLVSVEVSNNQQDFSLSGINFLYYQDETVEAIAPTRAYDSAEPLAVFAYGRNFINTTSLSCRLGLQTFSATFVTSKLLLCEVAHPMPYDDTRRSSNKFHELSQPRHALFEVSNNGKDFTTSHVVFEFLGACPTGYFCPKQLQGSNGKIPCPRGTFCPGVANTAFTLCPRGTYQPKTAQPACLRCPIGYHCPHTGMHVPRLCPAGYVCDVTGIEEADQPCPEGHYCLEGTATTGTTCTPTSSHTGMLVASPSAAEKPTTLRRQRGKDPLASVQARKSGCWRNETDDFGLQLSARPSRFWMELRQLPLAPGSSFGAPLRGRFCLDDSCVQLADADNVRVEDASFDYASTDFALRRPVACPPGTYCHPGTAASDSLMKNFTTAQPCFESMYCPEGSSNPRGFGECAPGFYCPFGTRIPCPAGSYCPQSGHISPLPCPPGTFNAMVAQSNCTSCPVGFICPGYGRVMPALCPPGYVCSKTSLASPNSLCPRGFYCPEGTATSDGFRNDTRVRPYPCRPGTYCLKGVVADEVRVGDYRYPQNCTAGFYCELGSYSPKGSGLCPPGFMCPSGTAAPIPTSKGTFAQLEGTVSAAECAPGYYAPTIESTECVPCPPGTSCENDGTAVASICPPGSYRGSLTADGLACLACPQGTWSKNWELRGVEECLECAPGTVCPIDGISNPCTVDDLPFVYTPVSVDLTVAQCLERGSNYFFGVLLEPWIDELGQGAHVLPDRENGRCYENSQPRGSELYQRFADFHGPLYEISTGTGVPHQGYGDDAQYPAPNMFARGSLAIDIPVSRAYDVARNCTPGFFYQKQWYPGTCEADIFCSASVWSKATSADKLVAQAQSCPEGYVCDSSTTADSEFSHLCPAGYVCGAGTTPDLTLDSPRGQLHELCPAGKYCAAGTAESQKERYVCPVGYFCPTGTANPLLGEVANDALRRRLSGEDSNPFLHLNYTKYVGEGDIRIVSAHDMRCFDGVDDDLVEIFRLRPNPSDQSKTIVVNRAEERNRLCARDHKWRTVELALRRNECDCVAQTKVVRRVFQLWKCTVTPSTAKATVYDRKRFGWAEVHNSATQCSFPGTHGSKTVNLAPLVADGGSGVSFQTGWTETTAVHSYAELYSLVEAKYAAQVVPVDPYVYDLHHAMELVETFGGETPDYAGFVAGSSEDSDEDLIRLDACSCSQMLKCPNGTTSVAGSDNIYDCVKTGDEVLERVSPIPLTSDRLVNGSDFQDLTGISGYGLGSIVLEPYEVAVITINTTQLERNLTYGAHYQISVYQDCKPCPPQYKCDLTNDPPDCTYPDDDNSTATRLYEKCMETYDGDAFVCNNMPFFCERRTLPLAEVSRSAADSGSNETTNIAGCCSCERQQMPYYFEDAAVTDRGFPDNKHGYLQFSIAALEETEVTVTVELVHGLYVRDFAEGFTQNRFDLTVFTPGRADYSPAMPSTNTFLAFLREADMEGIMLPLNLPEQNVRVAGTLTYTQQVATTLLINRMSDIFVGDPQLPSKRGFIRNSEQNSVGALVSVTDTNSSTNGSTEADAVVVPPTDYFGLYSVPDPLENMLRSDSWWAQELNGFEFLALPYLPFFSSCRGFDSNIFLFKMLETHPDCTFVGYDQTVEVDQYPWRKKLTPNADRCLIEYTAEMAASTSLISSISSAASSLTSTSSSTSSTATTVETFTRGVSLSCLYEENLEGGAEKLRWYEAPTGTVLFYITRDPAAADSFVAEGDVTTTGTGWGRSGTFQNYLDTDALIPVKVGDAGQVLAVPQEVYLNLSYYQVTPGQKQVVQAFVNFGKLCAVTRSADLLGTLAKKDIYPCAISKATNQLASKEYTLQVSWEPLNWFELMNLFQFTVDVYLGFFTLVAMASMMLGFVIWVINRLFTKMKRPPKFRMKLLLKNIASSPPIGIFMASVPIYAACLLIYTWWHVLASTDPLNTPSAASFEATAGDWLDQISLDKTRVQNYKRGRVGLSLNIIGIYLLLLGSKLLVPEPLDAKPEDNAYKEMSITTPSDPFSVEADKNEEDEEENEYWDPRAWKRANFLLTTVCFMAPMLVFWEFSYSPSFTANIYGYLVLFKLLRIAMEFVLEHFLHEKLLVMPFAVVLSASESMMAMGSADFIGFTLFYFVNLTLVMIEHLYTAPLLRRMRALWPKWRLSLRRRLKKRRRRTREQKAEEEAEWARVCEKIDNQAAGVEAVLEGVAGYSVVFTELFIAPILLAFQSFFSNDTQMPALYGVRQTDLLYYALFAVFIIPSNFVLGALQLNTMELAHGWKLYEYSAYQRHRFSTRDTRWPLGYTTADESIHPSCQSLDLLCFSSQLYFLLIVYSAGILLSMLGLSVCLRASYSFFGDPITLLIIGVVYFMMRALEIICIRIGNKLKVWKPRKLADGTLDEDLAAKLALGAGRQLELERERLELQALNSERFRHRFLERNRPWVLQHLAELFTPRTLQSTDGPAGDGRPNAEYIRDLYHELVNMGEGRRLKGDRSDISSDGEDDLEKMRRAWSNVPVEGASRDLALYWLARARKRRTFAKLVAGIVAANRQSECVVCGKREDGGYTLHVDLAAEEGAKEHDPRALDRLIDGFESELGAQEMDSDLWKAYFRKHAAYATLCNVCLTARQQALGSQGKKIAAGMRKLRADEFSSDEGSDEDGGDVPFAPIVVARGSTEGRVLTKWLLAARKRLGGAFPRPEAQEEMERYARKLKRSRRRAGKKDHVDSDDEGRDPSKHWRLELNEAARALAIRWVWEARDLRDAAARNAAAELRDKLQALNDQIVEADDWFFGRELREAGLALRDDGAQLAEEQTRVDEDLAQKVRATERDVEAFVEEKRSTNSAEERAFAELIAKEREDTKARVARELELLEAYKQKETEFAAAQRQAREAGELVPALVAEHRTYLAKMAEDRRAELETLEESAHTKTQQKEDAFARKLALAEAAVASRRALAQHRILALRKEARGVVRARESAWQSKARSWIDRASRKVQVKQQEDAEAQLNDKRRRKRVLLAT